MPFLYNVDYPLIANRRFWDNFDAEKLSPNRKLLHIGTGERGQIDENRSCGYDKFPLRHSDIVLPVCALKNLRSELGVKVFRPRRGITITALGNLLGRRLRHLPSFGKRTHRLPSHSSETLEAEALCHSAVWTVFIRQFG